MSLRTPLVFFNNPPNLIPTSSHVTHLHMIIGTSSGACVLFHIGEAGSEGEGGNQEEGQVLRGSGGSSSTRTGRKIASGSDDAIMKSTPAVAAASASTSAADETSASASTNISKLHQQHYSQQQRQKRQGISASEILRGDGVVSAQEQNSNDDTGGDSGAAALDSSGNNKEERDSSKEGGSSSSKSRGSSSSSSSRIQPFSIMHGHESRVTAITTCIYDYSLCACSLSLDGTLCVWNLADGRCMAMQPFLLNSEPKCCCALPGKQFVACAGNTQIEIVDLKKLSVVKVLEGHREWIQTLDAGLLGSVVANSMRSRQSGSSASSSSDTAILLSAGRDTTLKYWIYRRRNGANAFSQVAGDRSSIVGSPASVTTTATPRSATTTASAASIPPLSGWNPMPAFSIYTQSSDPMMICHSKDWNTVILVSEKQWVVYPFQGVKPLYTVEAPPNMHLRGAKFIARNHVLIYTEEGMALVYKLPPIDSRESIQEFLTLLQEQEREQELAVQKAMESSMKRRSSTPKINLKGVASSDSLSSLAHRGSLQLGSADSSSMLRVGSTSSLSSMDDSSSKHHHRHSLQDLTSSLLNVFKRKKSVDLSVDTNVTPYAGTPSVGTATTTGTLSTRTPPGSKLPRSGSQPIDLTVSPAAASNNVPPSATSTATNASAYTTRSTESSPSILPTPPITPNPASLMSTTPHSSIHASLEDLNRGRLPYNFQPERLTAPTLLFRLEPPQHDEAESSDNQFLWSVSKKFIMRGDSQGVYKLWSIHRETIFPSNSNLSSASQDVKITIREHGTTCLADGWPSRSSYSNSGKTTSKAKPRITASHFMLDKDRAPKLIHGFEDGTVSVMPSVSTEKPYTFQAHESRVTSLLMCFDSHRDQRVLITGSQDASIKLWEMQSGELRLLKTFYVHSEAVSMLFTPPDSIRKRLNNGFCSIGEDRSVVLFSLKRMEVVHILGGHSSEVLSVYWRPDLDYVLVRCTDGFVYVWHLSTGLLERRLGGLLSHELIEQAQGLGGSMRSSIVLGFSRKTAYIKKSRGFLESLSLVINDGEPDIQLLILSVRRTVGYINSKSDSIRQNLVNQTRSDGSTSHALTSALGYILQYGKTNALELLRKTLHLESAYPPAYIGLKGAGDTYSLIVPKASVKAHPFKFSPVLSALHTISCVSILNALSKIPELKQVCNACRKYYLHDMSLDYEAYEDPSFLFCAQFLKDSSKEVQSAARSVMIAVLRRMSLENAKALAEKLSNFFLDSNALISTNARKQNVIVALAILAYKVPNAVDGRIASITAKGLIEIMEYGGSQHITAISLLGEGYSVWQYYIPDPTSLCRQLFHMALPVLSDGKLDPNSSKGMLAQGALDAFVNIANIDAKLYVDFVSEFLNNAQQSPPLMICAAISSMEPVIREYPDCLVQHLTQISSLLLRVLDPHFPQVRKNSFDVSRKILKLLVETYPMVSFHQTKQRFAVGDSLGMLAIYDLKTASKWQNFEAHRNPITALSIAPQGSLLATYCAADQVCRLWNMDGSGLLNLMGVSSRSLHVYEVPSAPRKISVHDILKYVSIEWDKEQQYFNLVPGPKSAPITFRVRS